MSADEPIPVACTLDAAQLGDRLSEFRELFATALLATRREGAQLVFDLDCRTEGTARELAAREKECCGFWSFEFVRAGGRLEMRMGVLNDEALPLLEEFALVAASARPTSAGG